MFLPRRRTCSEVSPSLCSITEDDDDDEGRKRLPSSSLGARMASRKLDMEKEERRRKNRAWREYRLGGKVGRLGEEEEEEK